MNLIGVRASPVQRENQRRKWCCIELIIFKRFVMYNCERRMITSSDVGRMVAHFKMLTKEFPKRTEQNKEIYNRISFPSQSWKTVHRNTERAFCFFFFLSGAFRTSEGSVAYLYLGVQIFHLDSVDLMQVLVWKLNSYIFLHKKPQSET
jgi:hypothetical protein